MGTILARQRKNGGTAYMAKIIITREGKVAHRESRTFETHKRAKDWIRDRESELARPGALDREGKREITLANAIGRYVDENENQIGRTKSQVLNTMARHRIAARPCADITSDVLVSLGKNLGERMQPQTVLNYMSHLQSIFSIAKPAWNYPLEYEAIRSALIVMRRLGITSKAKERDRRPTLDELHKIMTGAYYRSRRFPNMVPMHKIIAFALFSTRRQEEIVTIKWADLDRQNERVLVRNMKHPGQKKGNHVWVKLPAPCLDIIATMPRATDRIFPYTTDAVSANFLRYTKKFKIEGLRFHDLRHEGISRLFEMGWNIPHVSEVSGHRSWQSLKRYTHIRQSGDKYAGWPWIERVTRRGENDNHPASDDHRAEATA